MIPTDLIVYGVSRDAENDKVLLVSFSRTPSDDDLRHVHEHLRALQSLTDSGAAANATDVETVLAALPNVEIFHAKDVDMPGWERKRVYNALTYLCTRGDLTRIGYGKYQRPPDAAFAHRQFHANALRPETMSENIARDMAEGRFPEKSEPKLVADPTYRSPREDAAYSMKRYRLNAHNTEPGLIGKYPKMVEDRKGKWVKFKDVTNTQREATPTPQGEIARLGPTLEQRMPTDEEFSAALATALSSADRAARTPAGVRVPEGWKLVPVEPTEEMLGAGLRAKLEDGSSAFPGKDIIRSWDNSQAVYRAMLAASPLEPVPGDSETALIGNGWVYHNPDAGEEYSDQHPVESSEVPDATDIRRSTLQEDHLWSEWQKHSAPTDEVERLRGALQRIGAKLTETRMLPNYLLGDDIEWCVDETRAALSPAQSEGGKHG